MLPDTLYSSDSSQWINNFISLDITESSIKNESELKYLNFDDKNLRPCQVNALKNFQNMLLEEKSPFSGYFDMATGAGKTFIFNVFSACAHKLISSNTKINVLIIEPKVGLLDQMVKDFKNFQKNHEHLRTLKTLVISSNHTKGKAASVNKRVEEGGYVLFCCQNSLENHLSILKNAPFVIYDEFHLVHERLLKLSPKIIENGGMVIGFSATPNEKKKYFDKKIFEYSRLQAQIDGCVAPWVVERLPTTLDSDEMNKFLLGLPNFLKNTSLPSGKSLAETRGIIYLNSSGSTTDDEELTSIKTADWLSDHLNKSEGLKNRVVSWHSKQSKQDSNKAINLFLSCQRDILVNITKFVEGYNTDVEWAIVLQKNTRWDQILGRLIRLLSSRVNKVGLSTIEKIACIFVPKNEPLPDNFEHPNQEQLRISQQLRTSDLENENSLDNENPRKRSLSPRKSKKTLSKKVQKDRFHS